MQQNQGLPVVTFFACIRERVCVRGAHGRVLKNVCISMVNNKYAWLACVSLCAYRMCVCL